MLMVIPLGRMSTPWPEVHPTSHHPRVMGWAPRTLYEQLVMFQVNYLDIGLHYVVKGHVYLVYSK